MGKSKDFGVFLTQKDPVEIAASGGHQSGQGQGEKKIDQKF